MLLHFTGPPVSITARMHSTPQIIYRLHTVTSLYGSSCANNSKGALNTPSSPSPFLTTLSSGEVSEDERHTSAGGNRGQHPRRAKQPGFTPSALEFTPSTPKLKDELAPGNPGCSQRWLLAFWTFVPLVYCTTHLVLLVLLGYCAWLVIASVYYATPFVYVSNSGLGPEGVSSVQT
eukprot:224390-Prorocentrum_minimum.AAC.1